MSFTLIRKSKQKTPSSKGKTLLIMFDVEIGNVDVGKRKIIA